MITFLFIGIRLFYWKFLVVLASFGRWGSNANRTNQTCIIQNSPEIISLRQLVNDKLAESQNGTKDPEIDIKLPGTIKELSNWFESYGIAARNPNISGLGGNDIRNLAEKIQPMFQTGRNIFMSNNADSICQFIAGYCSLNTNTLSYGKTPNLAGGSKQIKIDVGKYRIFISFQNERPNLSAISTVNNNRIHLD